MPDYNSGYGQALADVLEVLNEVEREIEAGKNPPPIQWWPTTPSEHKIKLRNMARGVQWCRAAIRGLKKRRDR